MSNFGSGDGPVLLNNVECNQSHTNLSQCVHELSIGLRECTSNNIAGVICMEAEITSAQGATTPSSITNRMSTTLKPANHESSTTQGTTESSTLM